MGPTLSAAALAALYLPGSPYALGTLSGWPKVKSVLTRHPAEAVAALRRAGRFAEAERLEDPQALAWGLDQIEAQRVLTPCDSTWPLGWTERLGNHAPPALWRIGQLPSPDHPSVAVVGSRSLTPEQEACGKALAQILSSAGYTLVSGGASGADSLVIQTALGLGSGVRCIEIRPHGLANTPELPAGLTLLSAVAPHSPFSGPEAMRRNALIHSWSGLSIILAVRQGTGGTWNGTADALKRDRTHAFVFRGGGNGVPGLIARGATPFHSPEELPALLARTQRRSHLFSENDPSPGSVRERRRPYR